MFKFFTNSSDQVAKRIAEDFLLFRSFMLENTNYIDLVGILKKRGNVISYVDSEKAQRGWSDLDNRMFYHVDYRFAGDSRNILAEGTEKYYGLTLTSDSLSDLVYVSLMPGSLIKIGSNAKKTFIRLNKFPQFFSSDEFSARFT